MKRKSIAKKMATVIVATSMLAILPAQVYAKDPTPAEEAMETYVSNSVSGEWEGAWEGRNIDLTLEDDGTFSMYFATADTKPGMVAYTEGQWYADGISVHLRTHMDGKEEVTLDYNNVTETLSAGGEDVFFRADETTESLDGFNGLWKVVDVKCNQNEVSVDSVKNIFASIMDGKMDITINKANGAEVELKDIQVNYDEDLDTATFQLPDELLGYGLNKTINGHMAYVADGHVELTVKMSDKTFSMVMEKI